MSGSGAGAAAKHVISGYAADLAAIKAAATRIAPVINRTPILTSTTLSKMAGCELFFKCENFQKAGSFKARGACNAVLSLDDEAAAKGVVTDSSGNHGQALAMAAGARGIRAHVVVPDDAPKVKVQAIQGYGAEVTPVPVTERVTRRNALIEEAGYTFIHSSNNPEVMAGQGTAVLELLEQIAAMGAPEEGPVVDAVVAPCGGGGLLSGTALAVKSLDPRIKVYGGEPKLFDDAARSKACGELSPNEDMTLKTVADGLRTSLGNYTWPVVRDLVDKVITVEEEEIVATMRLIWERMKIVVEPNSATAVAAVLSEEFRREEGLKRVAVILSGGNVDLGSLPWQKK